MKHEIHPRILALDMVDEGQVSTDNMLLACLAYMSSDDVYMMLCDNEFLSNRYEEYA